jgi:hypothetical protein
MDCPNCKLTNPEGTLRCDCGYDFVSGCVESTLATDDARNAPAKPRELLAKYIVRISAVSFLVLGVLAFHDFLVPPASRFLPDLPPPLMLAGSFLIVLGVVLLVGSFLPRKAAKPLIIAGILIAILGGLPFLVGELSVDKGVDSEAAGLISLFFFVTLPFVFMPGLAVAAAVLAALQHWSRQQHSPLTRE